MSGLSHLAVLEWFISTSGDVSSLEMVGYENKNAALERL
jgi:hypothetical protein